MPTIKGKDVELFSETNSYTQGQGYSRRIEYHALVKSRLYPLQGQMVAAGYNCTIDKMGNAPKWSLVGVSAGAQDGKDEHPVERWTWRKVLIQRDIFTKPEVAKEAREFSGTGGDTNPAEYRKIITDAVERGSKWPPTTGPSMTGKTQAANVYRELTAGGEGYELEYLVLTRTRQTTSDFAPRIVLNATSYIYTTAQLILQFIVPLEVQRVLPDGPAPIGPGKNPIPTMTPDNAKWGWRTRDHEGNFEGNFRFSETQSWVFANWSTYLYIPFV